MASGACTRETSCPNSQEKPNNSLLESVRSGVVPAWLLAAPTQHEKSPGDAIRYLLDLDCGQRRPVAAYQDNRISTTSTQEIAKELTYPGYPWPDFFRLTGTLVAPGSLHQSGPERCP